MIDLHSHTWLSDGELSPQKLIERAISLGIQQLAITDHDSVGAHHMLAPFEHESLQLLSGVEISTQWEGKEVHIVGILFDLENQDLASLLQRQQVLRRERAEDIALQLDKTGITGLMGYLNELPCESLGRSHIATFLVERGYVGSKQMAFSKYLGKRGRIQTRIPWCEISEAVGTIRAAGGLSIIAHPDRYDFNRVKLRRLLAEFADAGGDAVEVSYSNLHPEKLQALADRTIEAGLWASVGSDFHTPSNAWMDLGRIRQLPANCASRAIWYHPRWSVALPANVPAANNN
ncbi:MAG: PHP domain-containing protein [Pseudohongiella sp.]|nr:PHP domain-containing protein [Pseudohongiella sp.]MDO9519987.1 PHP domain-containing protein [Pseudohongiella sp.]MDP2127150.1 PHP domain-containing protein [Pseudohongiella sp.]